MRTLVRILPVVYLATTLCALGCAGEDSRPNEQVPNLPPVQTEVDLLEVAIDDDQIVPTAVGDVNLLLSYDGADLFRGFVLGYGPVADAVEVIHEEASVDALIVDDDTRAQVIQLYGTMMEIIQSHNADFLESFQQEMVSGDPTRIRTALVDAHLLAQDVLTSLGTASAGHENPQDQMCVAVVVVALVGAAVHSFLVVSAQVVFFVAAAISVAITVPEDDTIGDESLPLMSTEMVDEIVEAPLHQWSFKSGMQITSDVRYTSGLHGLEIGDFNGDGVDDRLYFEEYGTDCAITIAGVGSMECSMVRPLQYGGRPFVGDFDGNGRDDIMWRFWDHQETWWFSGTSATNVVFGWNSTYVPDAGASHRVLIGDFDGDAKDDAFWYGSGSTADFIMFGHGYGAYQYYSGVSVTGIGYIPVVGDFLGDSPVDDIVWFKPGQTSHYMWRLDQTMNHTLVIEEWRTVNTNAYTYRPAAADIDMNGYDDILWHVPGAGDEVVWAWQAGGIYQRYTYPFGNYYYFPKLGELNGDAARYGDVVWWPNYVTWYPLPP